jgi:glycosyltransferase involved in cell wall biosynthesis
MKLLVFAHTPPPHHGQSYMVKLMLEGFGGDRRGDSDAQTKRGEVECYHVNARFSDHLEDIGMFRWEKALLVLRYCCEAVWCRFRYGIRAFYYVPAPGKRAALYRDWIVMLLCRPFFTQFVHHWHAVGLGDWLKHEGTFWERWVTHRLLGRPTLGIALAIPSMRDALWFRSREVAVIANGIPDPCPDFEQAVLPAREARVAARHVAAESIFEVLYLAHCTAEKGLFDSMDGVVLLNQRLRAAGSPVRARLTVAGEFPREDEKRDFFERLRNEETAAAVRYAGFVGGETKDRLLAESDCLCFPTYYHAESLPVVVVESMAVGLPIVTTRWRAIPEVLPPDYTMFVPPRSPELIASRLEETMAGTPGLFLRLRERFLERFVVARHLESLRQALRASADVPPPGSAHLSRA